jgi:transposase-like protein
MVIFCARVFQRRRPKGKLMATNRKHLRPEEKVALIRRHLVDQVAISDLCDEYGMQPTQYYAWQRHFFENGALAFQRPKQNGRQQQNRYEKKINFLEEKLQKKNEVVSELLEEHVQLKKELGEL